MKIAYLVFAYKNPQLLGRLIGQLSGDGCSFFIHLDAKSNLDDFAAITGPNIFFTRERIPVHWAEFSGIEAILILIREALAHPRPHEYFVLLSGSEYPLKSGAYIRRFLQENRGAEFISSVKVPNVEAGKPLSRINTLRFPSDRPVARFVFKVLAKLGLARRDYRRHLGDLEPYAGTTWWALSREACQYASDFAASHPRVAAFFKNTFAPEEAFFHTILGNSPFRSRIRRNLLWEDWSAPGGHPQMINEQHLASFDARNRMMVEDVFGSGEVLFARKFSDDSLGLIQRMEEMIKLAEGEG